MGIWLICVSDSDTCYDTEVTIQYVTVSSDAVSKV